ncbi:hypothetical protein RGU12_12415 [Fredinandcohnia sp. QZ13]|uniref:hypothetical protein n=1 Tax=Fredinandcohnia sp. QZ13 TaxID=3073144 RepID=UPI0028533723|nr:hypothetical protein [Fredinandcohnia sp. QZ13]MDR4888339.1 hypothetical protein [Fredinandcohnia sp. QZ13]
MKKKIIMLLLLVLSILSACSTDKNEIKDSPLYEGENLTIGVVGKAPKVREKNIVFKNLELKDLSQENLSSQYNAVFIMKEHLSEAAKAPYAKIYKTSGIPFFFIESKKIYVAFTEENLGYEETADTVGKEYASGYYQSGDKGEYWEYGLYNDTVNQANIEDVFSRIFMTVSSINN